MTKPKIEMSSSFLDVDAMDNPDSNGFAPSEINENVSRYWGISQPERIFTLPGWKAEKLIRDSNFGHLALKIVNISDPATVDGEWERFDASVTEPLNAKNEEDKYREAIMRLVTDIPALLSPKTEESYYVFGNSVFDRLSHNLNPLAIIVARIGKTAAGEVVVYFVIGELTLILDNGGGGPGTASGAKIPSPK